MDVDKTTKAIGAVTAVFAMVGGGISLSDKIILRKEILAWDPEHFSITDGAASEDLRVVVARQKIRDDCSVEEFNLEVRDQNYIVHKVTPSVAKFSGPATETIDKFGYTIKFDAPEKVALGQATLIARIHYKCPEGLKIISYPSHKNLNFNITGR